MEALFTLRTTHSFLSIVPLSMVRTLIKAWTIIWHILAKPRFNETSIGNVAHRGGAIYGTESVTLTILLSNISGKSFANKHHKCLL